MDPDAPDQAFDQSLPLKGAVVCCTNIPPNETKDIEAKTVNLGGLYTQDLTVDVTHLIVGSYDTAKYRHAAKALAHTKAMDAGWVEALARLWREDVPIDFSGLEKEWQLRPLETSGAPAAPTLENQNPTRGRLLVSLTGFLNLEERSAIQDRITSNGGDYSGELNKRCTHLIVAKPEGPKYLAARKWNIKVVSIEWLDQTIERGMILDEKYFDPLLPPEERGNGARDSPDLALGKRQRQQDPPADPDGPRRKLRKTASMKLSSQRENVWGDILGTKASSATGIAGDSRRDDDPSPNPNLKTSAPPLATALSEGTDIFSSSYFYIQDFESRKHDILINTIAGLGGRVCQTSEELYLARAPLNPWQRFIVVPQDSHATAASPPPNASTVAMAVTEFFIERCLRDKKLHDPAAHVLGRPFPVHPIEGFRGLTVCSAGFTGVDLHHLDRAVRQLGARFEETFRRRTSLLVCKALKLVRKEKLRIALDNSIPVVREAWLWDCVATGTVVSVEKYMFPELRQRIPENARLRLSSTSSSAGNPAKPRPSFEPDSSAFSTEVASGVAPGGARKAVGTASNPSTRFHTARTHFFDGRDDFTGSAENRPPGEVPSKAAPRRESRTTSAARAVDEDDGLPATAGRSGSSGSETEKAGAASGRERDEAQRREEASRKERELLAFSTKLTSLIEPDANPGAAESSAEVGRRRRGILGRATSNVSAPGTVSDQRPVLPAAGAGVLDRHSAPQGDWEAGEGQGTAGEEDGHSLLTQVGYFDPEAAEARKGILGRLGEDGGRRVKTR